MTGEESSKRTRWPALFDRSTRPIFVLSPARRIRYVNAAWEKLTGVAQTEANGMACIRRGPTDKLARTLAVPSTIHDSPVTIRRAAPGHRAGPPWWEISFFPLPTESGIVGYLGVIRTIPVEPVGPRAKVPSSVMALRSTHAATYSLDHFAGTSATLIQFQNQIHFATETLAPVWLTGESGTGKETLARAMHAAGPTRAKAFLGLDCAAFQPYLIEGLLFGHGGLADSGQLGTLYLKNTEALPGPTQEQLLTWFETTKHKPKLICGSTKNASLSVRNGSLRPAFQTDYSTITLTLPPLRDRRIDMAAILHRNGVSVDSKCLEYLQAYNWPGNFRELKAALAEAKLLAGTNPIHPEHLPRYVRERAMISLDPLPKREKELTLDETLEAVEKRMVQLALKKCEGNTSKAATQLGIPRPRLLRRMEVLGIMAPGGQS